MENVVANEKMNIFATIRHDFNEDVDGWLRHQLGRLGDGPSYKVLCGTVARDIYGNGESIKRYKKLLVNLNIKNHEQI